MENNTGSSNASVDASATEVSDSSAEAQVENNNTEQNVTPEKKLTKKLKLKLDGLEVDEELPFEIDESNSQQVEYMKRHLQMSKIAQKRMNEAALTRKQAEQFIEALQNDPMKILTHKNFGGEEKFQKIAEEFLAKKIQQQMLSPEERRQIEMEDRLRKYEEQEKSVKEKQEQDQVQQLQTHYQEQYTKTITEALDSSNLPRNAYTVKRMAQLLQQNIKHGLELEPRHLAQLVREDYTKEIVSLIGNSNPEQIISMFGEETVNKLRKHDLEKLKGSLVPPSLNKQKSNVGSQEEKQARRYLTTEEYRARMDKIK